jgi:hypothetical protein
MIGSEGIEVDEVSLVEEKEGEHFLEKIVGAMIRGVCLFRRFDV